nr:hypothetical protein Iba_chr02bCG9090 [Ipomoea batatas]
MAIADRRGGRPGFHSRVDAVISVVQGMILPRTAHSLVIDHPSVPPSSDKPNEANRNRQLETKDKIIGNWQNTSGNGCTNCPSRSETMDFDVFLLHNSSLDKESRYILPLITLKLNNLAQFRILNNSTVAAKFFLEHQNFQHLPQQRDQKQQESGGRVQT